MYTKEDILIKAKALGNNDVLFKSLHKNKMSLTEKGIEFIKQNKLYSSMFVEKLDHAFKTYDIMMLGRVMTYPYFIDLNNHTITHFDQDFSILLGIYQNKLTYLLQDELGMSRIYGDNIRVQRIK